MTRRLAVLLALPLSFTAYLLPVLGPHVPALWGEALWMELTSERGERDPLWMAADVTLAIGLQAAVFLLFFLLLRVRRGWPYGVAVAMIPGLFFFLQWAYLAAIPARFLVEGLSAPERTPWEVECVVHGARLAPVRSGVNLALENAGTAWLIQSDRFSRLTMPGCRVEDRGIGISETGGGLVQVASSGAMLFYRRETETREPVVWYLAPESIEPAPLEPPPRLTRWRPTLAADGLACAWLEREQTDDGSHYLLWIRDLPSGDERSVRLPPEMSRHLRILAFDDEVVVANGGGEIFGLDGEGEVSWGPALVEEIGRVGDNLRRHGTGWVSWDDYRERGRYRVVWSLLLGRGTHEIPKGRVINSVALDPWGRFVAVSVSPAVAVGSVRDAVYVFHADEAQEVYRRYLPRYTRSEVAFLGAHFFAVTRHDEGESYVEVYRVPGPHPMEAAQTWIASYRGRFHPLLELFTRLDEEGLDAEDCGLVRRVRKHADSIPTRAPDKITRRTFESLLAKLTEAGGHCRPWRPVRFANALSEVELIMKGLEANLVYEHGLEALPELPRDDRDASYRVETVRDRERGLLARRVPSR